VIKCADRISPELTNPIRVDREIRRGPGGSRGDCAMIAQNAVLEEKHRMPRRRQQSGRLGSAEIPIAEAGAGRSPRMCPMTGEISWIKLIFFIFL
jgi:hypothetical protein